MKRSWIFAAAAFVVIAALSYGLLRAMQGRDLLQAALDLNDHHVGVLLERVAVYEAISEARGDSILALRRGRRDIVRERDRLRAEILRIRQTIDDDETPIRFTGTDSALAHALTAVVRHRARGTAWGGVQQ